jgi:uncharacterized membrane protein
MVSYVLFVNSKLELSADTVSLIALVIILLMTIVWYFIVPAFHMHPQRSHAVGGCKTRISKQQETSRRLLERYMHALLE